MSMAWSGPWPRMLYIPFSSSTPLPEPVLKQIKAMASK